jgi:hypothetical protein
MATEESEIVADARTELVRSQSTDFARLGDLDEGLRRLRVELFEIERALRRWVADGGPSADGGSQ